MMLYISVKFYKNIFNFFQDIEQVRFVTDRWTDRLTDKGVRRVFQCMKNIEIS